VTSNVAGLTRYIYKLTSEQQCVCGSVAAGAGELALTILFLNHNNLALELLVSTVNESHSSTMIQLIVGGWESHALLLVPCFVSWWLQDTHNPRHPGVEVVPQECHKNAALG
jgi:hypothetical protein